MVLGSAGVAFAKPATWETVDLVVHDNQGKQLLMVAGQLASGTALPAEVQLAVPAGLEVQWAGEILGGDVANDPAVTYTIAKSGDSDVYSFKLTKSRTAQIELAIPGAVVPSGSRYAGTLKWTPSQDVPTVQMGFRIPQGAEIATPIAGAKLEPGPTGYSYYRTTINDANAGQPIAFTFSYTVPVAAVGAATSSGSSTAPVAAIVAVLLVVVAGFVFAVSKKMRSQTTPAGSTLTLRSASANRAAGRASAGSRATSAASGSRTAKPEPPTHSAPRSKGGLIATGVIVALVIGVFLAIQSSSKPQVANGIISRTFSQANPCTSTVVPLSVAPDGDLTAAAEKLFTVLQSMPSITTAKVYKDQPRIEVGFCESSLQATQVRDALAATGLVSNTQ